MKNKFLALVCLVSLSTQVHAHAIDDAKNSDKVVSYKEQVLKHKGKLAILAALAALTGGAYVYQDDLVKQYNALSKMILEYLNGESGYDLAKDLADADLHNESSDNESSVSKMDVASIDRVQDVEVKELPTAEVQEWITKIDELSNSGSSELPIDATSETQELIVENDEQPVSEPSVSEIDVAPIDSVQDAEVEELSVNELPIDATSEMPELIVENDEQPVSEPSVSEIDIVNIDSVQDAEVEELSGNELPIDATSEMPELIVENDEQPVNGLPSISNIDTMSAAEVKEFISNWHSEIKDYFSNCPIKGQAVDAFSGEF